jgi:hypothetical protein
MYWPWRLFLGLFGEGEMFRRILCDEIGLKKTYLTLRQIIDNTK